MFSSILNDENNKIPILIITEKQSQRSKPLFANLMHLQEISLYKVDAVMLNDLNAENISDLSYSQEFANFYLGRDLLAGEVGCAQSHNIARKMISSSRFGGVILEDDARILNSLEFLENVRNFLKVNEGKAAVLSLAGWKPRSIPKLNVSRNIETSKHIRLLGFPPLAVGYALTPLAGKYLYDANNPIKQTADWPQSKTRYFVTNRTIVFHGDFLTTSIIDSSHLNLRQRPSLRNRVRALLMLEYFQHKSTHLSFSLFFRGVWLPKLFWYLDRLRITLRNWK